MDAMVIRLSNTAEKQRGFSIGLFIYFVLFLCDNFFASADNVLPGLMILRFGVFGVGFIFLLCNKISKLHFVYILFIVWILIMALIHSTLMQASTFYLIRYMSLCFVLDYYLKKYKAKRVLNSYFVASVLCMILNFIIDPSQYGLFSDVYESSLEYYGRTTWFTGSRNTFGEYFLVSTLLLLIIVKEKSFKRYIVAYIWGALGLAMSIYVWSSSSIVIMILMLLGITLVKFYKFSILQSICIGLAFNISIVVFKAQKIFDFIIVDRLHRNLTFTGRTFIWEFYLEQIKEHFICGSGSYQQYIPLFSREYPPHNVVMSVFESFGLIGFAVFCIIFYLALKRTKLYKNDNKAKLISLFFLLFLIRGTFENAYSVIFVYITLANNLPYLAAEGLRDGFVKSPIANARNVVFRRGLRRVSFASASKYLINRNEAQT